MVYFTYVSIRHSKRQLAEMKRQWDEQNRQRLMPLFISYTGNSRGGYLRIKNISGTAAFNISVEISDQADKVPDNPIYNTMNW